MWWLFFLLIPAQAQVNTPQNFTSPCLDQNHIFFVPGVLAAGGSSRACLSRFHPDGQARMIITLVTEDGQRVSASRDLATGDGGCLDLSVPQKPNTKADVNVNVRYIDGNCVWTQRVPVRIAASKVLVVHTERARYRPGEVLKFRVLALKTDLTPVSTAVEEIWLEGPGSWEVKAAQWNRVRTRTGLVQLQHELDELAPPGKWTLRARLDDGSQGSSTFLVGNYELPPFQLTVRHSAKVLRSSERLSWTVCVRYPWSEAVEGMLVIRIRGAGSSAGIRTAVRLRARACHRHAAAARRIQLDKMAADDVVIADFSFQEEGTRVWQNTTVVSQVVENPVSLEFLVKHKPVISPGLPYKLKIEATRWDDKPATNELVHVCRSPATSENDARVTNAACVDALTDDSGVARVMFTVEEHASPYYVFEASARNTHIRLVAHSAVSGARSAFGPLRAARTRSILPLYLRLPAHSNTPVTVHFVVITRGGTIYRWGATTQCPTHDSDQIHTTTRNSICPTLDIPRRSNLIITNSSDLDSLKDFHAAKIMLPLKMSHQMCPDSYLFAYFQYDGELVTASKHFEMEECFTNEVELSWDNRITPPGSTATLTLSTLGPALCALSAIDNAAKWTNPPHELKDEVMQQLRRVIQTQRNITQYDAAGDCFLTSEEPFDEGSELSASGVRSIGAGARPRCVRGPQSLTDEIKPRTDFAEAWLWRLLPVGSNGTGVTSAVTPDSVTRYEASAFCLSKTGVAVSQPAVLQVFREFFIHADGPKQLRRGDTTIMRYRLFNYLYESLSVQVTVASDQSLDILERTELLCIRARSSVARRLTITARELGEGSLRIRAEPKRGACGNNTTAGSGDEVVIKVKVEPEGVPTHDYKSALLCANTGFGASDETWKWPQVQATPGSESLIVWVTGDLNGPLLADADSLILLPRGCGEQNMQRLAANYLASLLQNSSPNTITTRLHMARGFVRQMQYLHPSGGFSAFGPSDPVPSTWLTAFCVRYLRRIHQTLYPDSPVPDFINRAERWLIDQQMENGCFRNEGQIFHRELRGGIEDDGEIASVALTAYTISSLMESTTILPYRIIKNSLSCFRALPPAKSKTSSKIYAHSILAYTLMRLRRYEAELAKMNEASPWEKPSALKDSEEMRELVDLIRVAKRSGEFVWWDSGNLATSIEATGYALLALAECPVTLQPTCAVDARAAVLWLSTHRSVGGGFVSTQDTLVALEALLRWSTILPPPSNLRVRIQSKYTTEAVNLAPGMTIPNVIKMDISDKLSVTVEGTGCALVQATRSYSSTGATSRQSLSADVSVRTDGPFNCDNTTNCYCAAIVDACVIWRGPLPAMSLAELSLPASYAADAGMLYAQLKKTNTTASHRVVHERG
ncbi:murinoglobulin-2-like isoform X2 [Aricia agestis]|uniref:murinoglobulin-2-like isoform X2 n=1 Tax=Aricia agestis TaxID=91739 RepID=UPI001C207F73|nr:murinoglobulin-2-like isoform X2 [Aricia agestis]